MSPQGDVGVYGNLVFRSVDSPQMTDGCTAVSQNGSPTGAACAPAPSPCTGFEGIQIFDIADLNNIELIASVPLDCGSHTHTVVPDEENDRVLIYNSVSGNALQPNPGSTETAAPARRSTARTSSRFRSTTRPRPTFSAPSISATTRGSPSRSATTSGSSWGT